jgi:hypothetical protein
MLLLPADLPLADKAAVQQTDSDSEGVNGDLPSTIGQSDSDDALLDPIEGSRQLSASSDEQGAAGSDGDDSDDHKDMEANGLDAAMDAEDDLGIGEDDDYGFGADSDDPGEVSGGQASSSDADDEGDDDSDGSDESEGEGGPSRKQKKVGFLEGGKDASFAKAFAKIMAKPVKPSKSGKAAAEAAGEAAPGPSSTAAARAAAAGAVDVVDVILAESASIQKRKAEVAEEALAKREAKKKRLELKQRGHTVSILGLGAVT